MKVLLLAHAFAPYNASGAVRAVKLAEHLLARGHDTRVLTARALAYPATLETAFPDDRVIPTPWWRIEAPLDMLRARLAGRISRVATPAPTAHNSTGAGEASGHVRPARPSLAVRGVVAWRSLLSVPDAQLGWIGPATRAGRRLLATWRPDLVYSTALPFSSHVVAHRLARLAGAPWVGEFRDLHSGNPYADVWPRRARLDRWIEQRVMASAAAVVSISPPLTAYLADLHGKPAATIMNGYDPEDFRRAPDLAAELDPGKVTLVYTGIIYPGRRDPAVLIEALRRLGEGRRRFEVRFYGAPLDGVMAAARRAGVDDVVRVFAPVPYRHALGLQKAADALLLLLWDSPLERGVLTGKLFEYAGAGRPVLALGCVDGAAADLVRARDLGLATTDPESVAHFLVALAERKARAGTTRRGAAASTDEAGTDEAGAGLTRRDQFEALERFLAEHGLLAAP